jgi:uncharacterized membrane protein
VGSEGDLEEVIGRVMRVMVIVSGIIVALGVVELIAFRGAPGVPLREIASTDSPLNTSTATIGFILNGLTKLNGLATIYFGLIVLVGIQVIRMVLAFFQFLLQRNSLYMLLSALVLFTLFFAIFVLPHLAK